MKTFNHITRAVGALSRGHKCQLMIALAIGGFSGWLLFELVTSQVLSPSERAKVGAVAFSMLGLALMMVRHVAWSSSAAPETD